MPMATAELFCKKTYTFHGLFQTTIVDHNEQIIVTKWRNLKDPCKQRGWEGRKSNLYLSAPYAM